MPSSGIWSAVTRNTTLPKWHHLPVTQGCDAALQRQNAVIHEKPALPGDRQSGSIEWVRPKALQRILSIMFAGFAMSDMTATGAAFELTGRGNKASVVTGPRKVIFRFAHQQPGTSLWVDTVTERRSRHRSCRHAPRHRSAEPFTTPMDCCRGDHSRSPHRRRYHLRPRHPFDGHCRQPPADGRDELSDRGRPTRRDRTR